ncbi:TPA: hypothetical protein ACX6O7_003755 [Photobacterium damselae]
MHSLQTIELLPLFIEKSIYPMAVRNLDGVQLMCNTAWQKVTGMELNGKKLSDIKSDDPFIQSNLSSCQIFDSLVTTSSIVLHETFAFKSYLVFRAPVTIDCQQCIVIQVMPMQD